MAQNAFPADCSLRGKIVLHQDLEVVCGGDLQVAPGTEIITDGHALDIMAIGRLVLNSSRNRGGLCIYSSDPDMGGRRSGGSGRIHIYANRVSGPLTILNEPAGPNENSGDVSLEYMSIEPGYSQHVRVGKSAHVGMLVGGYPVPLTGADHQFASAAR